MAVPPLDRSWRKSLPQVSSRGVKRSFCHLLPENSRNFLSFVELHPVLANVQMMLSLVIFFIGYLFIVFKRRKKLE